MPGTTRQKCGTKCENILMADTCVQPCVKNAAFDSNCRSFLRHLVRHAAPEGSVPLRVPRFLHSLVAVSPPKPPLAAAFSGGPRGTACPGRLAPGSGGPARSRTFKSAGDCPGNHRPLSSVQDGGAFSGAAIGCQRAAGMSRRGGGPGGGRSCADQTLLAPEYGSGETSCADPFLSDCDLCISQRTRSMRH